jgi:hypothetical protein
MNDSPFDFLNSINQTKVNLIRDEGRGASEYAPYLMNKGLSQFADSIMYANEMNLHCHLDKQMQYEYLLHSLRPRKRFAKWAKKDDAETTQKIMDIFGCSVRKAEEIKATLDKKTVAKILKRGSEMRGGI